MFKINVKQLFLFIFVGLIATACDEDDPPVEAHTDAEGFILEDENGNELYREFEGAIVTSNITLSVGGELELSVHFLDHDGNEIEHEEGEEEAHEDELSLTGYDANIATIEFKDHEDEDNHDEEVHCDELNQTDCEISDHCEWHSDDGACEDAEGHHHDEDEEHGMIIRITGISAGSTSFKLELMHEGHADYTSISNIPVTVTNTTSNSSSLFSCTSQVCLKPCCAHHTMYASK